MPRLSELSDADWAQALCAHDVRAYAVINRLKTGPKTFGEIPIGEGGVMPDLLKSEWVIKTETGYELTEEGMKWATRA